MQIITDVKESKNFVRNLGQSLGDSTYWKGWAALDVVAQPALDWIKQAKASALLRGCLPDTDGSILWLEKSLLVVFQPPTAFDPTAIQAKMAKALDLPDLKIRLIDIVGDAEGVNRLLQRLLHNEPGGPKPPPANYDFLKALVPNVEELLRQWHKERPSRKDREKPHIMVVDDDPMTLRLVGNTLERDYVVIRAQNGAEAIAKHLQLMPDIIFLDIGLPDCDGITLLNYMQQYDHECRIVMFSADDYLKTRVKAFAGGASGFLPKPFNLHAFQKHIGEWFTGKKGA